MKDRCMYSIGNPGLYQQDPMILYKALDMGMYVCFWCRPISSGCQFTPFLLDASLHLSVYISYGSKYYIS